MSQEKLLAWRKGLKEAVEASFKTRRRKAVTLTTAALTFILLVLGTFPEYSYQLLTADIFYLDESLLALSGNIYRTSGLVALTLVVTYASLAGVAFSNLATQLSTYQFSSIKDFAWASPGLLASGCAGCGAGVLGLLGFAGALAAMPFHGNLLRVGGIALLLFFLGRSGDPTTCDLERRN